MTAPTGWPPGMLQDDSRELSRALSSKPDARMHVRDVAAKITEERTMTDTTELRAAFEQMAHRDGFHMDLLDEFPQYPKGTYSDSRTHAAWLGFVAGHASATQQHEGLRKDAERYLRAISSDDNAEALFSAVLMHRFQGPAFVNAAFDAAIHPHGTASTGAASSPISTGSTPAVDAALSVAGDKT